MWNNMSYAISMAGERARLCYLWAREGDGLGRPQIEEGGRKGYHFGRGMNRDVVVEPNSWAISPPLLPLRRAIRYRLPT